MPSKAARPAPAKTRYLSAAELLRIVGWGSMIDESQPTEAGKLGGGGIALFMGLAAATTEP